MDGAASLKVFYRMDGARQGDRGQFRAHTQPRICTNTCAHTHTHVSAKHFHKQTRASQAQAHARAHAPAQAHAYARTQAHAQVQAQAQARAHARTYTTTHANICLRTYHTRKSITYLYFKGRVLYFHK